MGLAKIYKGEGEWIFNGKAQWVLGLPQVNFDV